MRALLIFVFPILEVYLLFTIGARIGVVNTLFFLLATFVFGLGLAKAQGKYILFKLKESASQGRMPDDQVLHGMILLFSGILFAVPGFISDVAAVFLLLPGTRHLVAYYLRRRFVKQMASGNFKSGGFTGFSTPFGTGFGGTFGFGTSQWSKPFDQDLSGNEREVSPLVIDVAPIRTESRKLKVEKNENES